MSLKYKSLVGDLSNKEKTIDECFDFILDKKVNEMKEEEIKKLEEISTNIN